MHKNAYCRIDSFCVLRQSFCGNFKLSAEFYDRKNRLLGCMLLSFLPSFLPIKDIFYNSDFKKGSFAIHAMFYT